MPVSHGLRVPALVPSAGQAQQALYVEALTSHQGIVRNVSEWQVFAERPVLQAGGAGWATSMSVGPDHELPSMDRNLHSGDCARGHPVGRLSNELPELGERLLTAWPNTHLKLTDRLSRPLLT